MSNNNLQRQGRIIRCGVIESVSGTRARIRTERSSACDTCGASAGCKAGGGRAFHLDVDDEAVAHMSVGDRVTVEMQASMGRQAVALGFAVPLVLFVAVLLGMHAAGCADSVAAMGAIGVLAVYYIIMYMLRHTVDRHFKVRVIKD